MEKKIIFDFIDKPKNNLITILIATLISWIISMTADLSNAGLGGLANLIFPIIFGLATIFWYYISRIFIKKYNWIITIAGIIYNLIFAYKLHYDLI